MPNYHVAICELLYHTIESRSCTRQNQAVYAKRGHCLAARVGNLDGNGQFCAPLRFPGETQPLAFFMENAGMRYQVPQSGLF